ncbi:Npt1/Npt2 family nucleotide transporter [Cohnella abietis]|uniref:ADP,ATP carrier protein n=1 Tax=Cohnella abietis TaxID=2507935 RepID=A0A3T1CZW5_9BACL|nr:Npt1/Npt2 family nucleotide transporter [Cohnella abietis]BBI31390.1 hypothetical protein KCTCHS21_07890 [Cohnella abietis]
MLTIGDKMLRLIWGNTDEDKKENTRVIGLFFYLFCVVSASTLGRTAADTLFLSRFNASQLSLMYLPQAASLIIAGILFQRYGSRVRLDRLIFFLIPAVSILVVLSRIGVGLDLVWVYPTIYVGYDVINFLMIVCFWQFASSVLDQRKAKKTIPLVGSGGIVGGIISGFGLKLIAPLVGTANLIYIYAGLQLLALVAVFFVRRLSMGATEAFDSPQPTKTKSDKRTKESNAGLFKNVPHLKYVAIMSAALVISLTLIDYQFKVILRGTLQNDALAGFMGSFYGFSGLCALLVQLFVAGKLVSRFGVMTSILVFPVALFAGSIGILFIPVLAMAILVKGSDKVVGDTIYSSVNQLIMFPISPKWRNRAKGFLDGVIRNGAKGVAAVSLIILSPLLSARELSFIIVPLLGVGIYAAIRVKKAYLQMLLSTLEKRGDELQEGELDLMDPASRQLLVGALGSADRQQALYALRVLGNLNEFDLTPYIPDLLRHSSPEVSVEALIYVERTKPTGMEKELVKILSETATSDKRVQSQALIALAAYAEEEYLEIISQRLEADEVEIKAGAIAGLIKYYGIEGMFQAVGTLKALIESAKEEERTAMASLFGRIGIREFYKPLLSLLQDPSPDVRRCALSSAAILRVPELVPYLVPLLQESKTRSDAIDTLASYEDKVILPLLEPYLDGEVAALHVPKVFERIGTKVAFQHLIRKYAAVRYDMRGKLLEAMVGIRSKDIQVDHKEIERLALMELRDYGRFAAHNNWNPETIDDNEVWNAVEQLRSATFRRVFQLLGLAYDVNTIDAVYLGWSEGDARRQANATEIMDQMLQGELRTELTKWMMAPRTATSEKGVSSKARSWNWLYDHGDEGIRRAIHFAMLEEGGGLLVEEFKDGALLANRSENEALRESMWAIRALRNASLFEGFTSRDLMSIVQYTKLIQVPMGELVFQEKDPGDSLYLIREGRAGVYRDGDLVDEQLAGDSFGQTSVLTRRLRTATIRAETDLSLLRLDSSDFYEAMFDRTELALEMMKRLSRKLRSAMADQKQTAQVETGTSVEHVAQGAATVEGSVINNESQSQVILRRVLVLQKIELFAHLFPEDFIRLAHRVEEVVYEPGEVICRLDEYGDTMFGIIEGGIRVHRGSETLANLGVGQCFGEMAIIDSGPRSADCTAVEHTVLLRLHRHQVFSFCFQQIDVLKSMVKVLADRLRETA